MQRILRTMSRLLACLAVAGAGVSCSAPKTAAPAAKPDVATVVPASGSANYNPSAWTSVQMPVRLSLTQPKKFALSGRVTMLRDSVINMSMRMLGMEVAAVQVTSDSVWVVDRFHKAVFSAATAGFLSDHNLSLGMLQGMMLGLDTQGESPVHIRNASGDDIATVSLSGYTDTPAGLVASVININAEVRKTPIELTLVWSPDRAVWNDPSTTVRFRNDFSGYRRYSLADIRRLAGELGGAQ